MRLIVSRQTVCSSSSVGAYVFVSVFCMFFFECELAKKISNRKEKLLPYTHPDSHPEANANPERPSNVLVEWGKKQKSKWSRQTLN